VPQTVKGDPEYPRPETPLGPVLGESPQDPVADLLGRVLGPVHVPPELQGIGVNRRVNFRHESVEGFCIARPRPFDLSVIHAYFGWGPGGPSGPSSALAVALSKRSKRHAPKSFTPEVPDGEGWGMGDE